MKKSFLNLKSGYTIIETMIAVSLFLVIIMTGMGALLSANVLHQKSRDIRSVMDSLSFVMEDMSRSLRTGYNYHCFVNSDIIPSITSDIMSAPKSCGNGTGWAVSFESANGIPSNDGISDGRDNDQWVYYIGQDLNIPSHPLAVWRATAGPYGSSNFVKLTPDEVVITSAFPFTVAGAESPSSGDKKQPLITIRLTGTITFQNVVTPFSLQTSASQRLIDI